MAAFATILGVGLLAAFRPLGEPVLVVAFAGVSCAPCVSTVAFVVASRAGPQRRWPLGLGWFLRPA